jgi:hypothetical protein
MYCELTGTRQRARPPQAQPRPNLRVMVVRDMMTEKKEFVVESGCYAEEGKIVVVIKFWSIHGRV